MQKRPKLLIPSLVMTSLVGFAALATLFVLSDRTSREVQDATTSPTSDFRPHQPVVPTPVNSPQPTHTQAPKQRTALQPEGLAQTPQSTTTAPRAARSTRSTDSARNLDNWADPVNQRVLGDRRWMATPAPEESARVQAILDAPMPNDPRVKPADRRTSIVAVRNEVDVCFAQAQSVVPDAHGRFIVSYDVVSSAGIGKISGVDVASLVGFEQNPEIADCVRNRVEGLQFPTQEDGELLRVDYPIFFENKR